MLIEIKASKVPNARFCAFFEIKARDYQRCRFPEKGYSPYTVPDSESCAFAAATNLSEFSMASPIFEDNMMTTPDKGMSIKKKEPIIMRPAERLFGQPFLSSFIMIPRLITKNVMAPSTPDKYGKILLYIIMAKATITESKNICRIIRCGMVKFMFKI